MYMHSDRITYDTYLLIVFQTADLSCIDMSITSQRQQAIDFAMPFMNTGKHLDITYEYICIVILW